MGRNANSIEKAKLKREIRRLRREAIKNSLPVPELQKAQESPKPPPPNIAISLSRLWTGLIAVMGLLGGSWVLYDLRPKVDIIPAGTINAADALETRFTTTNHSTFAVRNVDIACILDTAKGTRLNIGDLGNRIPRIAILDSEQPTTNVCFGGPGIIINGKTIGASVGNADMVVTVSFDYPLWWKAIRQA